MSAPTQLVPIRARARLAVTVAVATAALVAGFVTPVPAGADNSSTLTIVGTSDVVDSNLVAAVLKPDFEKAFPQYTLNYVSQGTGAAITTAESGAASALLVHAASLENQFVQQGYSEEQYGRAIFYGDYVLLGPAADPAGVMSGSSPSHDIVGALQKIAAAAAAGHANYVSRGGTPGTTVEEHSIWALTSGVKTCAVSSANGGGTSPSTTTGNCPSTISYPSWYHATGLTQGPNVENADTCNYSNGNCYVLTDRGTFDFLESTHAISHLQIVTRNNAASARGGDTLLVNSFHAYAINPAKFAGDSNVHLNLTAAEAFLTWVTSPKAQAEVKAFMGPQDPPFKPDAAPKLTTSRLPRHVRAGHRLTVTGRIRNVVPGTPRLAGVQISLRATPHGTHARTVATDTTNAHGRFVLHYRPTRSASYTVASPQISQIENSTLRPTFGDLLHPTSRALGTSTQDGAVTLQRPTLSGGTVLLHGSVAPRTVGHTAAISVFARPVGTGHARKFRRVKKVTLAPSTRSFHLPVSLAAGHKWAIRVRYSNPGVIASATSKRRTLVV
jgi:tungstate transport system substrate-binding protein